jgi:hypothetical protein
MVFSIKILEVRNKLTLTRETTVSTILLFVCTLDHLGRMSSFKQQRHHLSLCDPNSALKLTVKRHASTRLNRIIRRPQVTFTLFVKGGNYMKEHRPSPKNVGYRGTLGIPFPHLHKSTPGIWDIGPLSEQRGRSLSAVAGALASKENLLKTAQAHKVP